MNAAGQPASPEQLFAASPVALAAAGIVRSMLERRGPFEIRTSKSQVAFRRRREFAYLWRPGQYLANPGAEVVLSIALPRRVESGRFKEVVRPAPTMWMHHLEIHDLADLDAEVEGWLAEAADAAGVLPPDP